MCFFFWLYHLKASGKHPDTSPLILRQAPPKNKKILLNNIIPLPHLINNNSLIKSNVVYIQIYLTSLKTDSCFFPKYDPIKSLCDYFILSTHQLRSVS